MPLLKYFGSVATALLLLLFGAELARTAIRRRARA
jgi:hypothetical protein